MDKLGTSNMGQIWNIARRCSPFTVAPNNKTSLKEKLQAHWHCISHTRPLYMTRDGDQGPGHYWHNNAFNCGKNRQDQITGIGRGQFDVERSPARPIKKFKSERDRDDRDRGRSNSKTKKKRRRSRSITREMY